jgi:hypothetical protein
VIAATLKRSANHWKDDEMAAWKVLKRVTTTVGATAAMVLALAAWPSFNGQTIYL